MDERTKKAFDFAQDATKQLLTLSTGIVALTITFSKEFIGNVPFSARPFAIWAWAVFVVSVVCGVWTLLSLTGELDRGSGDGVYGWNVRLPSLIQVVTFLTALTLTVIFGVLATGP